jgi:hypothetical protein
MSETEPGHDPTDSFRPSLIGGAWSFRVGADALHWTSGSDSGRISYDDIKRVRLSYRPRSMQRHRFLTELWTLAGPKVTILSTSWKSISELERLDRPYRNFVLALHQQLAARGRSIEFIGGTNPAKFWVGLVVFVPLVAGIIGVVIRAFQQDAHFAALLIVAFLALFLLQGVNYFRRNRPVRYRPDAVPPELLPSAG